MPEKYLHYTFSRRILMWRGTEPMQAGLKGASPAYPEVYSDGF